MKKRAKIFPSIKVCQSLRKALYQQGGFEKLEIIPDGFCVPCQSWVSLIAHLCDQHGYGQMSDLCAVDYPQRQPRFDVVIHLLNMKENTRLRLKTSVVDSLASLTSVYAAAGWWEREAYDMFGITFTDHPHLTRILTEDGFEGHPLRKDFPLSGHTEVIYDEKSQKVIHRPTQLDEHYRDYNTLSPWAGRNYGASP